MRPTIRRTFGYEPQLGLKQAIRDGIIPAILYMAMGWRKERLSDGFDDLSDGFDETFYHFDGEKAVADSLWELLMFERHTK